MPELTQRIDSLELPWSLQYRAYTGLTIGTAAFGPAVTFDSGYPVLPCHLFRRTTHRNSFLSGKAFRPSFRQRNLEWYSRKPPPVRLAGKDKTLRKELLTDEADWRRQKPVRGKPRTIPPGWTLVALPDGKYRLKSNGYDPRAELTKYEWVPELRRSLRPVNRKWRRKGGHLPVDAKVNDLTYLRQTGWTDGYGTAMIHKYQSLPTSQNSYLNLDLLGGVFPIGNAFFFDWTAYGYASNPLLSIVGIRDDRAVEDQAAVLYRWQDEVAALSKTALRRHYKKLSGQKVDLATELSQGMKTVNQIADIAKRVARALTALKKLDIGLAFKVLFPTTPKGAANDFLAWKYGIKPLIGDLYGAAEHLAEYISRAAPLKSNGHAKATYSKVEQVQFFGGATGIGGGSSGVYEVRKATIRVKYGSSFGVNDNIKRQAASLGFTNPKNVAWELLPLSFVVDWFLPIGDFLSSLSSLDGLTVKESYKTVFIREEITRYTTIYPIAGSALAAGPSTSSPGSDRGTSGYLYWEFLVSRMYRESIFCERKVITLPELPIPQFKNPITKGHVQSAVALFTQLVSK